MGVQPSNPSSNPRSDPRSNPLPLRRHFGSPGRVDTVKVPCGSSGEIVLSLHNASDPSSLAPLLIYLPPCSQVSSCQETDHDAVLPEFLRPFPTAVINYRWPESSPGQIPDRPPLHWPTPLHDVLFGYSWITGALSPPGSSRRDVYVYGSYLGGGLAAALALTECRPHVRMAVRGFAAYNGIYNWTMFLPDHPVHRTKGTGLLPGEAPGAPGTTLHHARPKMPALFRQPSDLFDPFASPSLFFHSPGLLIPSHFRPPAPPSPLQETVDELSRARPGGPGDEEASAAPPQRVPRKGYLTFPPRQSPLKIPEALLLHGSPAPGGGHVAGDPRGRGGVVERVGRRRGRRSRTEEEDTAAGDEDGFEVQAAELAGLMRRSVEKFELKERMNWDGDIGDADRHAEPRRRVQLSDAGMAEADGGPGGRGRECVTAWLEGRMRRPVRGRKDPERG